MLVELELYQVLCIEQPLSLTRCTQSPLDEITDMADRVRCKCNLHPIQLGRAGIRDVSIKQRPVLTLGIRRLILKCGHSHYPGAIDSLNHAFCSIQNQKTGARQRIRKTVAKPLPCLDLSAYPGQLCFIFQKTSPSEIHWES
ncbi:hypothetical protein EGJ89_10230 [Stenotrophomonas maltophilia]|nr:hypothetical protein EGJ89_10230 [Stenotrophomonas maltophilia]